MKDEVESEKVGQSVRRKRMVASRTAAAGWNREIQSSEAHSPCVRVQARAANCCNKLSEPVSRGARRMQVEAK